MLPPNPESFNTQIHQNEIYQMYFGVPQQSKMPNLRAPAKEQELQHSPSRKSKLMLVHSNTLGYKHTASRGPAELSPVTSEKAGLAWEQGALQPSQGKPPWYPSTRALTHNEDQVLPKSSRVIQKKWMLNRLRPAYHNTPTQLPSPGATLRIIEQNHRIV